MTEKRPYVRRFFSELHFSLIICDVNLSLNRTCTICQRGGSAVAEGLHDAVCQLTFCQLHQKCNVTEDSRERVFLFQRLSIALQRGNAVSFLSTFTATD